MIQITTLSQFDKAKRRASAGRLMVSPSTLLRQYRVTNEETGTVYRVDFYKARDGRKFATCECKGAQGGYVCKHMGAALPLHLDIMLAAEQRERATTAAAIMRAAAIPDNPAFDDADDPDAYIGNWQ